MDIFTQFDTDTYRFVRLAKGGVAGNTVTERLSEGQGIYSRRSAVITSANNQELATADAQLKVPATDPYVIEKQGKLEGEALEVDGTTYRVERLAVGKDYDTGVIHFYRLYLKRASV